MGAKKSICILGGMGPEASVYMYKMLIDLSIRYFGAKNNDDFPEIVLYSIPVPDFISNDKKKYAALEMLQERVEKLNKLDLSCIGIACNTAHVLLPDLQKISRIPFVSMIDEVVSVIKKENKHKVGLLGTPSTFRSSLYQDKLIKVGIETLLPVVAEYKILEKVIRNVIAGVNSSHDTKELLLIADKFVYKGAEGVILGCTELPLAFPVNYNLPVYNSVAILAMALLRNYYGRDTIKGI